MGCISQKHKLKLPTIVLESNMKSECSEKERDENQFIKSATSIIIQKQAPKRLSYHNQQLAKCIVNYKLNKKAMKEDDQKYKQLTPVRYRGVSTDSTSKLTQSPSLSSNMAPKAINYSIMRLKKQSAKAGLIIEQARQVHCQNGNKEVKITMEMLEAEF